MGGSPYTEAQRNLVLDLWALGHPINVIAEAFRAEFPERPVMTYHLGHIVNRARVLRDPRAKFRHRTLDLGRTANGRSTTATTLVSRQSAAANSDLHQLARTTVPRED